MMPAKLPARLFFTICNPTVVNMGSVSNLLKLAAASFRCSEETKMPLHLHGPHGNFVGSTNRAKNAVVSGMLQ